MVVLGIETSCDETAAAVYDSGRGLLSHLVYSQTAIHAPYGGVVPELASRDHVRKLLPLVSGALAAAGLPGGRPDGIAYTAGPGLIGALLVGASFATGLAAAWGLVAIPVHHMEAHLLAALLEEDPPAFPFVALLVSGGHTMLVEVRGLGRYRVLGQTLDDAAGEAFDKTAKLLGLPYPGGPALAECAATGRAGRFRFPRPLLGRPGLDFSFSGLKTAVMLKVRELAAGRDGISATDVADLAKAFEAAVVDALVEKCLRAVEETGIGRLVVAGGVGANRHLRVTLKDALTAQGGTVYYPRSEFCTDNAAMVALAGALRFPRECGPAEFLARARWNLEELQEP